MRVVWTDRTLFAFDTPVAREKRAGAGTMEVAMNSAFIEYRRTSGCRLAETAIPGPGEPAGPQNEPEIPPPRPNPITDPNPIPNPNPNPDVVPGNVPPPEVDVPPPPEIDPEPTEPQVTPPPVRDR
ncbi:hypothetical protein [Propionivibrio sp.]|uniref:hypothetical protein n=1 Tax=Propionivibrio sp. TaxID=2212460 RepID=UPI0039E41186